MLLLALAVILAIAGVDQLIKCWIQENFIVYEEKPFLQIGSLDILHLHFIENDGSAFSSFSGQTVLLLILSGIGIGACAYALIRYGKQNKLMYWSLVMIMGGALGNLVDRICREGKVVDYLDLQLFDFAVFNFADCFVTVGTILLMIYIIFFMEKKDKENLSQRQEK